MNKTNNNQKRVQEITRNLQVTPNGLKVGYLPIDLLTMPEYQRDKRSAATISRMAASYSPSKAGYIIVSQHDNNFAVIDGGHRTEAAKLAGESFMLCQVYTGLTLEQEAYIFAHQGDNVTMLKPYDKWRASRIACEPAAVRLNDICDKYNVKIRKSCVGIGTLRAVGKAWQLAESSPAALDWIFYMINRFNWAIDAFAYSESNLIALFSIWSRYDGDKLAAIENKLVALCHDKTPKSFEVACRAKYPDRGPAPAMTAALIAAAEGAGDGRLDLEAEI